MSITFQPEIPITRVPGVYMSAAAQLSSGRLPELPPRILVVGGKLSSATAVAGTIYQMTSDERGESLFGAGYQVTRMVKAVRRNAPIADIWACAIAEGSSVKAAWTLVVAGTAKSGNINLTIAGIRLAIAVLSTDATTAIAANINAAINAVKELPVTSSVASSTVTVAAKNGGEAGNSIDIRTDYLPSDVLPGITLTKSQTATGASNPDVAPAIAALGDARWTGIVTGYGDATNLGKFEVEAANRAGPNVPKEVIIYSARADTQGNLSTFGGARNSAYSTVAGINFAATPIDEIAAAYCGCAEGYLSVDPAAPLTGRVLVGVLPPPPSSRFTWAERNALLYDGIATLRTTPAGDVVIEREISTYQTDGASNPDDSWLDITTAATVRYLRYATRRWSEDVFNGFKIADDDTRFAATAMVTTPKAIRNALIGRFREYESAGLVERMDEFSAGLIVERDATDQTRVNMMMPVNLVNGLRIIAGQMNFQL